MEQAYVGNDSGSPAVSLKGTTMMGLKKYEGVSINCLKKLQCKNRMNETNKQGKKTAT